MLIDISHLLEAGMPTYPGIPPMQFGTLLTHEEAPQHGTYAQGTTFQMATYTLGGNTGTYLDAPFHRHPQGQDLAHVSLEKLANLPGLLVSVPGEGPIERAALSGRDLRGKAVLVRTDWSKRWGGDYFRSGPYLTADVCHLLVQAGAALVGIDCANIDDMTDPARPAHTILLQAAIPVVEHLCALDRIPAHPFRFFAVPPAIRGGTSFPVRAFVLCEE